MPETIQSNTGVYDTAMYLTVSNQTYCQVLTKKIHYIQVQLYIIDGVRLLFFFVCVCVWGGGVNISRDLSWWRHIDNTNPFNSPFNFIKRNFRTNNVKLNESVYKTLSAPLHGTHGRIN